MIHDERSVPISVLALGANLPSMHGSAVDTLERAVAMLSESGLSVTARSRWYSTPAWPEGSGPDFVNGAVAVTGAEGEALLARLHSIETALGRTRKAGRWDARVCDLDLLCTGQTILPNRETWQEIAAAPPETARPGLILPHPLLHRRGFVLVPMADVAASWCHPVLGQTVAALCDALPDDERAAIRPLPG